jgi:perosamine synthetase
MSKFKPYKSVNISDSKNLDQIFESGILSKFLGVYSDEFYGGKYIQELEEAFVDKFQVKHAISVNSWTSGLMIAVGSLDIEPGDEIITTPWTMSATAMSILHFNAIPIFCDIDPNTFNIDASKVESLITPRTKAILSVDIFGQSADTDSLNKIAKKYNLKVISDTAQAITAKRKGKFAGTITDIGGYSLNRHKHINTGEGGIVVTNNDDLANRMRLLRNHAENAVGPDKIDTKLNNMIGFNFRMCEIEAAIAINQLKKIDELIKKRCEVISVLLSKLNKLPGLIMPYTDEGNTHVYYLLPLRLDIDYINHSRDHVVKKLIENNVPGVAQGYVNVHQLPLFQAKIAFGSNHFPWSLNPSVDYDYSHGICPVAEELHDQSFFSLLICNYDLDLDDVDLIFESFYKTWDELGIK